MEAYLLSEFVSPNEISFYSHEVENVIIEFVVGTRGEITDCYVLKGFSEEINNELKRVFLDMPPVESFSSRVLFL